MRGLVNQPAGLKINGAVDRTLIAAEALAKGDLVERGLISALVAAGEVEGFVHDIIMLTDTVSLVIYSYSATSALLYIDAVSVIDGVRTIGPSLATGLAAQGIHVAAGCRLTDTTAAVFLGGVGGFVVTVAGDLSCTKGATTVSPVTTGAVPCSVDRISDTQFLVAASTVGTFSYLFVGTVSGTTVTFGLSYTSGAGVNNGQVVRYKDGTFVLACFFGSSSFRFFVGTVVGTVVTVSTSNTVSFTNGSVPSSVMRPSVHIVQAGTALLCHGNVVAFITYSGSTVSSSSAATFRILGDVGMYASRFVSDTDLIVYVVRIAGSFDYDSASVLLRVRAVAANASATVIGAYAFLPRGVNGLCLGPARDGGFSVLYRHRATAANAYNITYRALTNVAKPVRDLAAANISGVISGVALSGAAVSAAVKVREWS